MSDASYHPGCFIFDEFNPRRFLNYTAEDDTILIGKVANDRISTKTIRRYMPLLNYARLAGNMIYGIAWNYEEDVLDFNTICTYDLDTKTEDYFNLTKKFRCSVFDKWVEDNAEDVSFFKLFVFIVSR